MFGIDVLGTPAIGMFGKPLPEKPRDGIWWEACRAGTPPLMEPELGIPVATPAELGIPIFGIPALGGIEPIGIPLLGIAEPVRAKPPLGRAAPAGMLPSCGGAEAAEP